MSETIKAAAPDKAVENDDDVKAILAANITVYRNALKLSRAELAERIGITEAAIGQYERGTRTPQVGIVCKLADVFNVSVDKLVGHGTSTHDSVKEYRFDEAVKFVREMGYVVFETEEGIIKISSHFSPVVRVSHGVASFEKKLSGNLEEVLKFNNRESFTLFFERLSESFMFATGARPIVESVLRKLKFGQPVSLPKLFVTKQ